MKLVRAWSVLVMLCCAATVLAQPTPEALAKARTIPIADVHMHNYQFKGPPAQAFLEQMDKNGVAWGGAVGDYRADVAELLASRYIPALGQREFTRVFFGQGEAGLIDPQHPVFVAFFDEAERLFAQGLAKGFGELHTDNHTSGPMRMRRHIRTDNPVMRRFYSIASKHHGFVQIHSQLDDDFVADVLKLTADYPQVLTILSHCLPLARPDDLAALFKQRPNLVCELSAQGYVHNRLAGLSRSPRVHTDQGIRPGWLQLIEAHPDRIMIGTDACCGWFDAYSEMVQELRSNFLPYLKPDLMEQLAYKNAVRLLRLDP
jgi:predicted TIM-barrel fold metal-dependent hydrolase